MKNYILKKIYWMNEKKPALLVPVVTDDVFAAILAELVPPIRVTPTKELVFVTGFTVVGLFNELVYSEWKGSNIFKY